MRAEKSFIAFPSLWVKLSYCFEGPPGSRPILQKGRALILKCCLVPKFSLQSALPEVPWGICHVEGFPTLTVILRLPSKMDSSYHCSYCLYKSRFVEICILKSIPLFNILFWSFFVCTFFPQPLWLLTNHVGLSPQTPMSVALSPSAGVSFVRSLTSPVNCNFHYSHIIEPSLSFFKLFIVCPIKCLS